MLAVRIVTGSLDVQTAAIRRASSRIALAALVAAVALTGLPAAETGPVAPSMPSLATSTGSPSAAAITAEVRHAVAATGTAKVIVQATPATVGAARAAVVDAGGEVLVDLDIVSGFSAVVDAASLEALTSVRGVAHVTLDGDVTLAHTAPDGGMPAGDSSYVETVGADVLHADGVDGAGVGIAIIDTGVTEVADLAGRVRGALDLTADGDDTDWYGHGTFIAGIAAGDGASSNGEHAGVDPGAHVVPVKIAGRNGSSDISHVLAAIQYVVSFKDTHDIGVLNLSLGTDSDQSQLLSPLNHAVERAWDAGIVVVVSGGNHGEEGPGRIPKPADDPLVITVGATDSMGTIDRADDEVAGYSSLGPSIADGFEKPDVVAPGSHLISLIAPGSDLDTTHTDGHVDDAHAQGSGTSFAAGVVSGAAALLLDAHPDWTPDQVKEALTSMAAPGPVGHRNVDGHGALDVAAAVQAVPAPDSQGHVVRATGIGSLEADRGSLEIEVSTSGLFNTLAYVLGQVFHLTGDTTAQLESFDATEYATTDWTGSNWYGSNWYGSNWYGSNWYGSNWYGSNWYGSNWYGSNWYGSNWYGSNWYHDGWD